MPRRSNMDIERERIEPPETDDAEADLADDPEGQEEPADDDEVVREDDEQSLEGRSR